MKKPNLVSVFVLYYAVSIPHLEASKSDALVIINLQSCLVISLVIIPM